MKPWKMLEKKVAKELGGLRRIRVSYSESIGDVLHKKYSIECKYGKQVPAYCNVSYPTYLYTKGHRYLLTPSDYIGRPVLCFDREDRNIRGEFLEKAFRQARQYAPKKQPIVCVKPRYRRGFVMIERDY